MAEDDLDRRIRERAYRIWREEGCPEGRAEQHWEQAKMIVALEDNQQNMLKPVKASAAEPIEAMENAGEFPTLTDQGEEQTYPSAENVGRRTK